MYATGRGLEKNYAEAAKWFGKAAHQGNAEAQVKLGSLYSLGEGVPQDFVRAHMWFNLAAAQSSQKATEARAAIAQNMTPAQIGEAQKLAREWQPIQQPPPTAAYAGAAERIAVVDGSAGCKKFVLLDDFESFIRWLTGYRDGITALVAFDKRIGELPRDVNVLGALVLSTCHANPDKSIGEVATGVIESLVNKQPGRRLNLGVPRQ